MNTPEGDATRTITDLLLEGERASTRGGVSAPILITNADVRGLAQLGGNLHIKTLGLQGGVLNPGNSIGTIEIENVSELKGRYIAEINENGEADLLKFTGHSVTLNELTLQLEQLDKNPQGTNYKLDHDYTVIEAYSFGGTQLKDAVLGDSLKNHAVKLEPVEYKADPIKGEEGKSAPSTIESVVVRLSYDASKAGGYLNTVYNAIPDSARDEYGISMTNKDVLKDLTGEIQANTIAALSNNASVLQRSLQSRVRSSTGAGFVTGAPVAQNSSDMALPRTALPQSAAYPLWAEVVGGWNRLDATEYASKTKSNFGGVYVGGDADVGAGWRVGGSVGYGHTTVKTNERSSKNKVDSATFALYAGTGHELSNGNRINVSVGTAYTHHRIHSKRSLGLATPVQLKGKHTAHDYQIFADVGYELAVGQSASVEPFASLAWQQIRNKAFSESGHESLALRVNKNHNSTTTFGLGLRGTSEYEIGERTARIFASLAWQHLSGDRTPSVTASFLGNPTGSFVAYGNQLSKNALATSLGIEADISKNAALGVGYNGNYGSKHRDNSASAYVKVRF